MKKRWYAVYATVWVVVVALFVVLAAFVISSFSASHSQSYGTSTPSLPALLKNVNVSYNASQYLPYGSWNSTAFVAAAVDGSAVNASGTTTVTTAGLVTTGTSDIIFAWCITGAAALPTLSDAQTHTLSVRASSATAPAYLLDYFTLTAALASDTFTCSTTVGSHLSVVVFAISGVQTSLPFDPSVSFPHVTTGSNSNPTHSDTTTKSEDVSLGFEGCNANVAQTAGTGYTLIKTSNAIASFASAEDLVVPGTSQTETVGWGLSCSGSWDFVSDAVEVPFTMVGQCVSTSTGSAASPSVLASGSSQQVFCWTSTATTGFLAATNVGVWAGTLGASTATSLEYVLKVTQFNSTTGTNLDALVYFEYPSSLVGTVTVYVAGAFSTTSQAFDAELYQCSAVGTCP